MDTDKNTCRCIIRHAVTGEEYAQAKERLAEARSLGDTRGTLLALASLAECPSSSEKR